MTIKKTAPKFLRDRLNGKNLTVVRTAASAFNNPQRGLTIGKPAVLVTAGEWMGWVGADCLE